MKSRGLGDDIEKFTKFTGIGEKICTCKKWNQEDWETT